jgi:hypothetical protein
VGCFVVPIIPPASNVVSVGMPSVSSELRVSPLTPLFATAAFAASANSIVAAHA